MNPAHPSYRKIALGRTSVLAAIWERKGEWVHEAEVAADVSETWDSTQGHVAEHLAALAQYGAIDERASERGGHEYRDPGILNDWVTEKGLEALCEESMSWDPSSDIQPGRWLLVLGSQVIATASSYAAMRMMLVGERLPKGAVMLEVSATHRVLIGGSESRSVAL